MTLTFKINEGLGIFLPTDVSYHEKQMKKLRGIVESGADKDMSPGKVVKGIKRLLDKDPLCLAGSAVLGEILEESGKEEQAYEVYTDGYRAALKLIPEDFAGPLDSDNNEVQCFLRCQARYVESLLRKGEYTEALTVTERLLELDSEDAYDREIELGELALLAGQTEKAETILFEQVEFRPIAYYSLSHLAFNRGEYTLAVSYLRRAFILAPYAASFLSGQPMPPNPFWECGPEAPDYQEELSYVETLGGDLWLNDHTVHIFLCWLSQTAVVLKEKAALVALSEKCFIQSAEEEDEAFDNEVEAEFEAIMAGIDEESSAALANEVEDPEDEVKMRPWELLSLHQQRFSEAEEDYDSCDCEECNDLVDKTCK